MSDDEMDGEDHGDAPPTYEEDLAKLVAAKAEVYAELGLADTRRNRMIFEQCAEAIAFGYENNRPAQLRVLKRDVAAKVADPESWAHITD